ncbi:hypothetical protein [Nocardioides bizhenqiangii]|uniref:Mammalian cell entry protein n=1 Tax=Nocardioides bizhenqiangii TaxID=3095076 RepID=A0ABZ0ZRV4_9ACTN|nr:hypothetical protein [Nocardioides sp. HM61]WQQ27069.1 hypothetical protein SHK19_02310 [Nocardioides sp. HM61]
MIESPSTRRAILAVLVLLVVACLGIVVLIVMTRSTGDGLGERLSSLQDDAVPGASVSENREQLLSISRTFATRFNTYDESMLDAEGHLTEYAEVEDLMTPKFGGVFADNVGYAEETVSQLGVASNGTVYAVGVVSQDEDSAAVLVAGTIELSYPVPDEGGGDGEESEEDPPADGERLSTGPQRFRYELSLVKVEGNWLVDDVDDIDDGLPPFSQPSIPETEPGETPPTNLPPTNLPTTPPSDAPSTESTESTEGGEQ